MLKELTITVIAMAVLSLLIGGGVFGMYEDQMKVCNFENECQIISVDDYMTRDKADKLYNNFNEDLDTFDTETQNSQDYNEDILIHLDNECRDNYHNFCFGEAWNSLESFLN